MNYYIGYVEFKSSKTHIDKNNAYTQQVAQSIIDEFNKKTADDYFMISTLELQNSMVYQNTTMVIDKSNNGTQGKDRGHSECL